MIIVFNPYCATGIRGPWMLKARGFPRPSVQCTLRSCRARRHGTHIKQVLRGNHGHVRRQPWGSQHSTFRWVLVGCIGIPGRAGLGASFCSRSTHFKKETNFISLTKLKCPIGPWYYYTGVCNFVCKSSFHATDVIMLQIERFCRQ